MISAISEYVQKVPQLTLYAEHMNMLMIDTDTTLKEFKNLIQEKYSKHHPRLLVLLGNSALLLRDEYRELWGDIPIVLWNTETGFLQVCPFIFWVRCSMNIYIGFAERLVILL